MTVRKNIRQSLLFIALVLGLSYFVFWGPLAFFHLKTANLVEGKIYNPIAFSLFLIGGFIPSIIGIVLTLVLDGKKGLKELWLSAINIKIGYSPFLVIIGYVLLLGALQLILYKFLGGKFDYSQFLKQLPTIFPLIILGPLSEEFGWRGFLQKKLDEEYSSAATGLIIGVAWSLWHLPLFYMLGTSQHEFHIPFIPFMVAVTSSSFVYTYIYNKSNKSLFSAIFLHWIGTFIMQVIASQVVRTTMYNLLECVPGLIIGCVFLVLLLKTEKAKSTTISNAGTAK